MRTHLEALGRDRAMKQKLSSGAHKVAAAAQARPAETRWSLIEAVAGAVLGLMIGGVGIAAMGARRVCLLALSSLWWAA